MTGIELKKLTQSNKRLKAKKKIIEELYNAAISTPSIDTTKIGSKSNANYSNYLMDKCIDMAAEFQKEAYDLMADRYRAHQDFKILDGKYREIMELRYLAGMNFEDISECVYLSARQVYRLHKEAVDILTKKCQ